MLLPCKCKLQVRIDLKKILIYIQLILDPNEKGIPNNILVVLCAQLINGKYVPGQRELIIGCAAVGSGPKRV